MYEERVKAIMVAVVDWFLDSKAGAVVSTFAIIAAVGFGGPAIAHSLSDATAAGYTGSAKVVSHQTTGSFCMVVIDMDDIQEEKLYGPKGSCHSVVDGMTIHLDKGRVRHQQ